MTWGWWPRGLSVPLPSVGLHEGRECFGPLLGLVHRLGHQPSAQHGTSRACLSPCSGLSVNKRRGHIHAHGLVCIILILVLIWIILILPAMLLACWSETCRHSNFWVFFTTARSQFFCLLGKWLCELKPELTPSWCPFPYWILTVFSATLIWHIALIIFLF